MEFDHPTIVFTAENNVECHLVVELLRTNGISALAVEDQSGVSLFALGTISQFHKPNVWVDSTDMNAATTLVREFENQKRERDNLSDTATPIVATCDECSKKTTFPGNLNGTTQDCKHCGAYLDVGEFEWDEDDGEIHNQ